MLARIQKSMKEKDQGFTLIELLVVMIIIGILAAIAIPVFLSQKKKAVDTAIKSDITNAAQNIETAYVDSQTYPDTTPAGGYQDVTKIDPTIKTSTGDTVEYFKLSDDSGFCLRGFNTKSDATGGLAPAPAKGAKKAADGSGYYWYVSTTGGLQTGVGTAAKFATTCK